MGRENAGDLSVPAAYIGVILIWTTTPLAIKWSTEGSHFLFGVTGRMAIGALVCFALLAWRRGRLPIDAGALRAYLVCGLGIYGGMTFSFWGSQFIPSGWISVIFGLTPMFTGLMARLWIGEPLPPARLAGMSFGLLGLLVIYGGGAEFGEMAGAGIGAVVLASLCQSASAVWVKKLSVNVPILAMTAVGVTIAALLDGATWLVSGIGWPAEVTARAGLSILYLGIGGSVIGFLLYFYILKHVEATRVALITLVTPVLALLLGHFLNAEPLSRQVYAGTALILCGLLVFQLGGRVQRSFGRRPDR
jgi:drug/metabolite transporter (DMT)-like permease